MDRPDPFDPATEPTPCYATMAEDFLAVSVAAQHDGELPEWTHPDTMNALRYEGLAVPKDDQGPARLTKAGFDRLCAWRAISAAATRPGGLLSEE